MIKEFEIFKMFESKKPTKIRNKEIDPYDEEDWGWNKNFKEDDFKDKYIVYKLKRIHAKKQKISYYVSVLHNHYEICVGRNTYQNLNVFKRGDYFENIIPLNEREIERIKDDKIELIPHGYFRIEKGIRLHRIPYSSLLKKTYFIDKNYINKYLYE